MDKEIIKSLKKALIYLRAEENEKARSLLVKILKQDPENDQAWFLLSFSVPQEERQITAVEKAISLNPNSRPAIVRLALLKGEPEPEFDDIEELEEEESNNAEIEDNEEEYQYVDTAEENDLLSQRLFETSTLQEEKLQAEADDDGEVDNTPTIKSSSFINETEVDEDVSDFEEGFGSKNKNGLPSISPRMRNIVLISIVGVVIVSGLMTLLPKIVNPVSTLDSNNSEIILPTNTETPTLALTEKINATSTVQIIAPITQNPSATPIPATISPNIMELIPSIQSDVKSVRGLVADTQPIVSMETNENMQNMIRRMATGSEFDTTAKNGKSLYLALGLMNSSTGYVDYLRNQWGDPGIGLYLPENDLIAFSGFRFGNLQKYLYALEYSQFIIEKNYRISQNNIVPTCSGDIQLCQVWTSLVKGDAMFTSGIWLDTFGTEEEKNHIEDRFLQYFLIPVQGITSFIFEDIQFPYIYGEAFVKHLYGVGGWSSVDLAYFIPPTTTEQIIHPEKFISSEPAILIEEIKIDSLISDEWINTYSASIGEWTTYMTLAFPKENISGGESVIAENAAAGWGGDRIQVYRNVETSQNILAGHWAWDTTEDATEFMIALQSILQTRYAMVANEILLENHICWKSFSEFSCIKQIGNESLWITAPKIENISDISDLYNFETDLE